MHANWASIMEDYPRSSILFVFFSLYDQFIYFKTLIAHFSLANIG